MATSITGLGDAEHGTLTAIIGFNEHDLILVFRVQRMEIILENAEMEHGRIRLLKVAIPLRDEFGTAEAVLRVRWITAWNEDGRVVNFDVDLSSSYYQSLVTRDCDGRTVCSLNSGIGSHPGNFPIHKGVGGTILSKSTY